MKSHRKELWLNTPTRVAFINITKQVQECIDESSVREGLALVKRNAHNRVSFHQRRRVWFTS